MDQFKLLCQLEKYNDIIDKCQGAIKELEDSISLKSMNKRVKELKSISEQIERTIASNSREILKLERLLKEQDYRKRKLEDSLYSGRVSDIKQLEQLTLDKEKVLGLIYGIESNIFELMDENEGLEKKDTVYKADYEGMIVEKRNLEEENYQLLNELKSQINDAALGKDAIIPKVEPATLNRYKVIREKRGKAIAPVKNDICGGCNMGIPTYLIQDIKRQDELIYCESCGRLLYYIEY